LHFFKILYLKTMKKAYFALKMQIIDMFLPLSNILAANLLLYIW